jgi:hypothetical protein
MQDGLKGPRNYSGKVVKDGWIGDGRAKVTAQDIRHTLYLYAMACLIQISIITTLLMTRLTVPEQLSREAQTILHTLNGLKNLL